MRGALLGLVAALAAVQEPAPRPEAATPTETDPRGASDAERELARVLCADVRSWLDDAELPAPADVQALADEAVPLADPELARALGELGHRLDQAGRGDEARALFTRVGEQAGKSGDLALQSWALDWLGQNAWIRNDLDRAAELLARAAEVDLRRNALLENTRHLADVARLRLTQGRFDEALGWITRAEEAARSAGSSAALRTAAEIHGSLLFEVGRHREALALCLASPDDAEIPARDEVRDETRVRLDILASDVLADVGRLESAAGFARRAHEIALEPAVLRVAPLLHLEAKLALGLLLGDLGRCDEALARLDEAAAAFERIGDARGAAWAQKNRGFALFAAGRHAEALPAFEQAARAGAELGVPFLEGIGALGAAEALLLGAAPADEERIHAALATVERVGRAVHERPFAWRIAAVRGRLLLARGAHSEALEELRTAVVLVERWRRRLGASGLVEHALRQRSDPYRDAAFAAARLGRMEEALHFAGLLQARVLDELRARRDGPLPGQDTPALAALRERVGQLELQLKSAGQAVDTRGVLEAELERALEHAEDELDAALLSAELASGRALSAVNERVPLERLGAALAEQRLDVALVYLVGASETLVLRVDAGSVPAVQGRFLPLARVRLEHCIAQLRAPLARLEAGELDLAHLSFDVSAARELHAALVRPLELPDGARLALVTDGALAAVPFELFVAGGELEPFDFERPFAHLRALRFLADEHATAYFGSLARLARPVVARAGEAVIFVAPAAVGVPQAAAEAQGIAHALGGARIVADARADEVGAHAREAALVHFAAHGRIDPERPAHGHLVLGGGAEGAGARLESWQAAELALDGARVVLSACHTGRGDWHDGAGLAGLTSGFLLGGAREVVASRWAVDDRVTARFMELLYAELAAGRATSDALHAARARLRTQTDERGFALTHPAFWAAWFVQR